MLYNQLDLPLVWLSKKATTDKMEKPSNVHKIGVRQIEKQEMICELVTCLAHESGEELHVKQSNHNPQILILKQEQQLIGIPME